MSCLKIRILLSATFCTTVLHAAMVSSLQKPFSQFKGTYDKAVQLYQTGEHDKAIKLYESIVDLKLDAADVYYNLGLAQLENEQFDSAQQSFKEALAYNNKDYEASIQLAISYKKSNNSSAALESYKEALQINCTKHSMIGEFYTTLKTKYPKLENVIKNH